MIQKVAGWVISIGGICLIVLLSMGIGSQMLNNINTYGFGATILSYMAAFMFMIIGLFAYEFFKALFRKP